MLAKGCGFKSRTTICNTKDGHCGTFITSYPFKLCCYRTYVDGGTSTTSTCAVPGCALLSLGAHCSHQATALRGWLPVFAVCPMQYACGPGGPKLPALRQYSAASLTCFS